MAGLTKEQRAQRAAEKAAKEAAEKVGAESSVTPNDAAASTQRAADADASAESDQADAETIAPTEEPDLTGLVLMVKDGETLPVHPTCVRAHINAGWKAVE